ncbi:MAG: BON domain-containing protein [Candidatus Dadabacteria bacterium]
MKRIFYYAIVIVCIAGSLELSSCKNKKAETTTETTTPMDTASTAPVQIAPDDQLTTGVKDATKDFPGVNATVRNGEVTLTGNIKRDRLPMLMQSLHALNPKKINNNLTVEP